MKGCGKNTSNKKPPQQRWQFIKKELSMSRLSIISEQNARKNLSEREKWVIYTEFKQKLARENLTPKQYEDRIKIAVEKLGL